MPTVNQPTIQSCCCTCSGFLRLFVKYVASRDASVVSVITQYWYDANMTLLFQNNIDNNLNPNLRTFATDVLGIPASDYTAPYPNPQPVGTKISIPWLTPSGWPYAMGTRNLYYQRHYDCGWVRLPKAGTASEMECVEVEAVPYPRPDGSTGYNYYSHFYSDYIPIKYQWT